MSEIDELVKVIRSLVTAHEETSKGLRDLTQEYRASHAQQQKTQEQLAEVIVQLNKHSQYIIKHERANAANEKAAKLCLSCVNYSPKPGINDTQPISQRTSKRLRKFG